MGGGVGESSYVHICGLVEQVEVSKGLLLYRLLLSRALPWPAVAADHKKNISKMQILGPNPELLNQNLQEIIPRNMPFLKFPQDTGTYSLG